MLTLNDGRNELWQWDTGRTLAVDADCSQVHFSNKVFGRSIDVDVVDGVATIPDILLQIDKDLNAWAFVGTAENGYTKISKVFKVNKRNKPADYVFTPPEQTTLGEILERLDDIESAQDPDAIKNAVEDYLDKNPIHIEETDPTVPEWAKQPTPPDVKIPDKLPNPHSITFTGAVDASYDGSNPVEIKIPDSGGNVDLTGYATEQYVKDYAQPKGEYLTAVPEGYAKTEDIPTKPEDIGAQPSGNYLTEVPSGYATEEFVKNKIAEAELGGEEVDLSGYAQKSELPTKVSQLQNDAGYLTEHQDISGKLDASELPTAINTALAQAKASGEFDGKDGADGAPGEKGDKGDKGDPGEPGQKGDKGDPGEKGEQGIQGVPGEKGEKGDTGAPGADGAKGDKGDKGEQGEPGKDGSDGKDGKDGSAGADGVSPTVSVSKSGKVTTVSITDKNGTKTATINDGADGSPGSNGKDGTSVTVSKVTESAADGGSNVVTFSDGKTLTVKNGKTGATGAAGKDAVLTMFISPTGSDSNDGLTADTPKATVNACVNAGAVRISAKRGVYTQQVVLNTIGELEIFPTDNDLVYAAGVEREPIVFELVDNVAVSSLSAYNSIKRVAYSNSANTQFDKVFTKKSQPPVVTEYGSRYNSTVWLLSEDEKAVCIKLKPVLTVAECEAESNTFTYVSGYIYINANLASVAKIIVPTNWETGFYVNGAGKLVLKEVEVRFSGTYNIDIRNCAYFDFYKCAAKYTSYASGFHPFNSNGKMTACYATKNFDGYGISGYGHTTYVDCVSEYNFDDGMSHHDGTSGTVIGGRYEGNGKGGNAPAYGAKVNIYGGLYKDNASFGIGYLWATDIEPASGMVQGAVMVGNPTGLAVNKNCDVTAMGCIYKDNTVDVNNAGNLVEYNSTYVKTVNGIKPDENGNVKIEVSGGSTAAYTNVLPLAINSDGTPFVGTNGEKGYKTDTRISSSGVEKASDKNCCSGFIACKPGDTVYIKNIATETSGYSVQYFYNSSFSKVNNVVNDLTLKNGVYSFTVPANSEIEYVRLTVGTIDDTTIVTVNEEITD